MSEPANISDTLLFDQTQLQVVLIGQRCYNLLSMPPYPNLVSDSALLQETLELLRHSGGRAASTAIADCVFKISNIDEELASLLVADLVRDDLRFKVLDGHTVELQANSIETGPLDDLEFVVVDVEATGAKMPPNRIIELGAYRIRKGRIVDEFVTLVNPELPIPRFVMTLTRITNDMVKSAPVFCGGSAALAGIRGRRRACGSQRTIRHELSESRDLTRLSRASNGQLAPVHGHALAPNRSRAGKLSAGHDR